MHEQAMAKWRALRQRYRHHLDCAGQRMDEHCRVALAATGGRIRPAIPILRDLVAADSVFRREFEILDELNGELGFTRVAVGQPSANPKPRKSKKRAKP